VGDQVLRFLENIKELADAVIPFQQHQDDPKAVRVAEQLHEPVRLHRPGDPFRKEHEERQEQDRSAPVRKKDYG